MPSAAGGREPKTHVLVLNWNRPGDTLECLATLPAAARLTVIDNGSTDDSVERLKGFDLLRLPSNLGFARGFNEGIRHALAGGAERVVLLNNDTLLAPGLLDHLAQAMVPDVGIAGPVSFHAGDRRRVWASGGGIHPWVGLRWHFTDVPAGVVDRPYMPAVCWMVRREVFEKVGLLPTCYGMYFEDTEFCVRTRRAGWRVVCAPSAILWHKVSLSTGGESNPRVKFYATRNRFRFVRRLGHAWAVPIVAGINAVEFIACALSGKPRHAAAVFRGALAGIPPGDNEI